jgi:exopolysaccharide production protein ExoY
MKREVFDVPEFVHRDGLRVRSARYLSKGKRALDIVGVIALAPVVAPIVGALWLAVRSDGGAGFFGHERVGREGRVFRCWKLRTMVPNARERLREHLLQDRAAAREWAETYKLKDDPRVTRLGRLLRASSLDELPQIWNVLTGEMSLVGPRPVPRDELLEYAGYERAYFMMRPGITGLWQVSGRNGVAYRDRVQMDVTYARRATLWLDLRILGRTLGVVLRRTGC